jgi:hypothetical protein
MIQPAPRAPELPGRGKSGSLGDRLHVEPGPDKQFTGQRHTHPVYVFGDAHAGVVVEKPGKITRARGSCVGKRSNRPIPRGIGGHDILNPVDHGMDVIAALKPRGQLWIGSASPQIDDEVAGDGDRASVACHLRYDVQHQIDARGDAGTGQALPVIDEEPVLLYAGGRRQEGKLGRFCVMGGALVPVKQPGTRRE